MTRFIHFGSGQSGAYPEPVGLLYIGEARRHAASAHPVTGEAIRLNGKADFLNQLDALRDSARVADHMRVQYLDLHSHGAGGLIALGPGSQWGVMENITDWTDCEDRGYESMFAPNAEIVFFGCSVADGGAGEYFLARAAWIFLRESGGTVAGYRSLSWSIGDSGGVAYRLRPEAGDRVEARITAGGHVILHNAGYLRVDRLRARVRDARREIDESRRRPAVRSVAASALDDASGYLDQAEQRLIGVHHRYSILYAAHWYIARAERALHNVVSMTTRHGPAME